MSNRYVSDASPVDFEFAVWLMDLVDRLDYIAGDPNGYMTDENGSAGYNLMKFIYGDGM